MTKRFKERTGTNVSEETHFPSFVQGWKPGYVGRCVPGAPISLSIQGGSRCARTSLRVCKSILGCEIDNARFLRATDNLCNNVPMTFTCPDDGFYGVMTRSDRIGEAERVRADAGIYPAPEKDVFAFEEGAFYGNLFDPDGLASFREVLPDGDQSTVTRGRLRRIGNTDEDEIPYRRIYSCYSLENAEEGIAYLSGRICAKPDAVKKCFPNPPQPCRFKDIDKDAEQDAVCRRGADDRWVCKGADGVVYPALAVFLHEPCGLTDSGCAHLPKALPD